MDDLSDGLAPTPIRKDVALVGPGPNLRLVKSVPRVLSEERAESLYGLLQADMELVKSGKLRAETPPTLARLRELIRRNLVH